MRKDEEPRRPSRDAEHLADRRDGVIPGNALVAEVGDELLAAQPSP
jgi:hypothetical protein